jgi:hypothetical protein
MVLGCALNTNNSGASRGHFYGIAWDSDNDVIYNILYVIIRRVGSYSFLTCLDHALVELSFLAVFVHAFLLGLPFARFWLCL